MKKKYLLQISQAYEKHPLFKNCNIKKKQTKHLALFFCIHVKTAACTPSHWKEKTLAVELNNIQLIIHNFLHLNSFHAGIEIKLAGKEALLFFFPKSILFYLTRKTVLLSVLPEAECLWLMQGCLLWNNQLQPSHHQHSDQIGISGVCLPK